jgi:hypothetical protein
VKKAVSMIATHKWGAVKRIIFMSDGEDAGHPETLFSAVSDCVASKIIIDTVMFGSSPEGEATLRKMSSRTGGIFCLAKDAATLRRTFLLLEGKARGLLGKGKP